MQPADERDRIETLRRAIMVEVGRRGTADGYTIITVEGYAVDEIDAVVQELAQEGLLEAVGPLPQPFGPPQPRFAPSHLTEKGRAWLKAGNGNLSSS